MIGVTDKLSETTKAAPWPAAPSISVIIPTFNRPDKLSACLGALAKLDYPRNRFEVVVVDDGSPTPLDSVVAAFRPGLNVQLLR